MLMFTVLGCVLMVMPPAVCAMLVKMGVLMLMFMIVGLSRSMRVLMAMDVLMRVRTFHVWYSFL
jgi:hypothetical protein